VACAQIQEGVYMSPSKYDMSEAKITRWEKEGRGSGVGADYKPWLETFDVPSDGRKDRPKGIKTNRIHHLLSKNEEKVFCIYELSSEVIDIREQYPIPRDETEIIAKKFGLKHPRYPKTAISTVMTSDFRLTINRNGQIYDVVRTVKEIADLHSLQTLAKLEIERLYYLSHNIDWGIIVVENIPKHLAENCMYWIDYFFLGNLQIDQPVLEDIYTYLTPLVKKKEFKLYDLAEDCNRQLHLRRGTAIKAALHFIVNRCWHIDWHQEFSTGQVLNILGESRK
jgi:hypothetical protein